MQSYNSLYNFNLKEETFSNTEDIQIKYFATQVREAVKDNQKAKTIKLAQVIKLKIIIKNPFTDLSNYKVIKAPKYALETETETAIKPRSVIEIETLLNTISIASQNGKKSN